MVNAELHQDRVDYARNFVERIRDRIGIEIFAWGGGLYHKYNDFKVPSGVDEDRVYVRGRSNLAIRNSGLAELDYDCNGSILDIAVTENVAPFPFKESYPHNVEFIQTGVLPSQPRYEERETVREVMVDGILWGKRIIRKKEKTHFKVYDPNSNLDEWLEHTSEPNSQAYFLRFGLPWKIVDFRGRSGSPPKLTLVTNLEDGNQLLKMATMGYAPFIKRAIVSREHFPLLNSVLQETQEPQVSDYVCLDNGRFRRKHGYVLQAGRSKDYFTQKGPYCQFADVKAEQMVDPQRVLQRFQWNK
jgi:hypothetical protein